MVAMVFHGAASMGRSVLRRWSTRLLVRLICRIGKVSGDGRQSGTMGNVVTVDDNAHLPLLPASQSSSPPSSLRIAQQADFPVQRW